MQKTVCSVLGMVHSNDKYFLLNHDIIGNMYMFSYM